VVRSEVELASGGGEEWVKGRSAWLRVGMEGSGVSGDDERVSG
jgi:hypothetical protein